jgi:hypothetical protein
MQNLLSFQNEASSPFKERQLIREAEESMQWRARDKETEKRIMRKQNNEGGDNH